MCINLINLPMTPSLKTTFIILLCLSIISGVKAQTENMVVIKGGVFIPLYGIDSTAVEVNDFLMDIYPVSNSEYTAFLQKYPEWNRNNIKRIFADKNYLSLWENENTLGDHGNPDSPVTNISWFAAKKYCECLGKRLPTVDEWEYTAMADEHTPDARKNKNYNQYILKWYETPKSFNNTIGSTFKNYWGVYDLHGLVWEWTLDFNSVLISGESRKDFDKDSNLFCGSAAVGSSDLMNYAAFMRHAFRGSMKANYSVRNLGFRCVKDLPKT